MSIDNILLIVGGWSLGTSINFIIHAILDGDLCEIYLSIVMLLSSLGLLFKLQNGGV